jgi:hypothetical protein
MTENIVTWIKKFPMKKVISFDDKNKKVFYQKKLSPLMLLDL